MKKSIVRFFHDTNNNVYIVEKATWGLAGKNGIAINDPRLVPIGELAEGIDSWLLLSISGSGADMTNIEHVYDTEDVTMVDVNGLAEVVSCRKNVAIYKPMNLYDQPLKNGFIEIDIATYNANVAMSEL